MAAVVGSGQRQSNPRQESITDIGFLEDRVLVAGLSNEEFASTLRAIPFPFKTVANGTIVEIYHGGSVNLESLPLPRRGHCCLVGPACCRHPAGRGGLAK